MPVEPFRLNLTADEILEVQESVGRILRSGRLILGPVTREFEAAWANYTGSRYGVAVSSGSAALEILLKIHGARGTLIAVPTNTNFASVAAIMSAGGTPVFLDMAPETLAPTLKMVTDTWQRRSFAGLVWVHIGGLISPEFPGVVDFCRRLNIFLIEDAAHAHGSWLGGRHAGTFGSGGAFSFCATKVLTTMEGGMIVTDDRTVAELAASYRNQGQDADFGGDNYYLGSSWRLPETSAAMGLIQLRKFDATLARRAVVAGRLAVSLDEIEVDYCDWRHMSSASQYKLIVRSPLLESPEAVKERFRDFGVVLGGGVYERPCHLQPVFRDLVEPGCRLEAAEYYCPRQICPPVLSDMSDAEIDTVAASLRDCLSGQRSRLATAGDAFART